MTVIIPLTQGKETIIDKEDYERVSKYKWCYSSSNGYAVSRKDVNGETRAILLHRYILGTSDGLHTDHINMDKLDNRKTNLRECEPSDNYANVEKRSDNKSGYKGVYWRNDKQKYQVTIRKDNKTYYLGLFESIDDAIRMYDFWIVQMRGEFSRPNRFEFDDVVAYG